MRRRLPKRVAALPEQSRAALKPKVRREGWSRPGRQSNPAVLVLVMHILMTVVLNLWVSIRPL